MRRGYGHFVQRILDLVWWTDQMGRGRGVDQYEVDIDGETLVVASASVDAAEAMAGLSVAEREVAIDAAGGMSTAAIAHKRNRAPRTIANQLASVYRKLRVTSRSDLARLLLGGG